ncbi:MAG TPA: radical SAM protein [Pontiellaceae bacterium]|nr:radical SAM protein [Pontiellaceae bacterium]
MFQDKSFPFQITDVVGLSPFLRLRKETTKVVFAHLPHLALHFGVMSSRDAALLSLFDGRRNLEDVIIKASILTDTSYLQARKTMYDLMKAVSPDFQVFVNCAYSSHKVFDASDYMIAAEKIDINVRLEAPLTMMLQPTPLCEVDCVYCYACRRPLKARECLSLARIVELLDEAVALGIYQINLCGGDGFCREDFVEIVAACRQRDLIVDLSTKCRIDKNMARRLADAGLDYIQVSLDSYKEETADLMYGRKGHFRNIVTSIENLVESGIFTRTNSIVTTYNFNDIRQTIGFIKSLGVRELKFSPAFRSMYRDNEHILLSFEQKEEYRRLMRELEPQTRSEGLVVFHDAMKDFSEMTPAEKREYWFEKRARCSAGRCSLVITPDGNVVPCEEMPQTEEYFVGDVRTQSIKEVWNSPKLLQFTYPSRESFAGSTACYACADFDWCTHAMGHCFRDSLKVYGDVYETNPFCPRAKATTNRIY